MLSIQCISPDTAFPDGVISFKFALGKLKKLSRARGKVLTCKISHLSGKQINKLKCCRRQEQGPGRDEKWYREEGECAIMVYSGRHKYIKLNDTHPTYFGVHDPYTMN